MPPDIWVVHALPCEQEWNGQHNHGQHDLKGKYKQQARSQDVQRGTFRARRMLHVLRRDIRCDAILGFNRGSWAHRSLLPGERAIALPRAWRSERCAESGSRGRNKYKETDCSFLAQRPAARVYSNVSTWQAHVSPVSAGVAPGREPEAETCAWRGFQGLISPDKLLTAAVGRGTFLSTRDVDAAPELWRYCCAVCGEARLPRLTHRSSFSPPFVRYSDTFGPFEFFLV
jgi:hypothetical protein